MVRLHKGHCKSFSHPLEILSGLDWKWRVQWLMVVQSLWLCRFFLHLGILALTYRLVEFLNRRLVRRNRGMVKHRLRWCFKMCWSTMMYERPNLKQNRVFQSSSQTLPLMLDLFLVYIFPQKAPLFCSRTRNSDRCGSCDGVWLPTWRSGGEPAWLTLSRSSQYVKG